MKIVFLTRRFYPDIGGVEKHVLKLSGELLKKGHSITIISEIPKKTPHKHSEDVSANMMEVLQSITHHQIPINGNEKLKKWSIWKWLIENRAIIKDADVIHCHDVFFWYLPLRFLYPLKKVYITFHGYESYPLKRKAIIVRKLSEWLSHGNICIGDFIKTWYGTNPTFVSYGAVDIPKEKTSTVKNSSAVFIGRLDNQTGINMYTKAYSLLKKKYAGFNFTVVGEGPYRKLLTKDTDYKGFEIDAEKYFSTGRYAFVSRYLSILEAMARKRLVFAVYDNPIKRDYLKKTPMAAFMVIADTPEEIASSVEYYLSHPKNEQDHIENAYTWVSKQSWENMGKLYVRLWTK